MTRGRPPEAADLDACEREPLPFSGRIQDVGVLLAQRPGSAGLSHYSANLERFFDPPAGPESLHLDDLFKDQCAYFEKRRQPIFDGRHFVIHNVVTNRGVEGNLTLSQHTDHDIYEFEAHEVPGEDGPVPRSTGGAPPVTRHPDFPADIDVEETLARIHALTGYPKIMLYRFLEDESGEVVAELADETLDRYQGLRFPASDIPQIARNLYIDNPFRLIFDTQGPSVGVLAVDRDADTAPGTAPDRSLDLSLSTLRSVSPVHIEYLGNMGIRSSASFPVRVMGKLWGLLAMHAPTPTAIPLDRRVEVTRIVEQALGRRIMDTRIRRNREHFNANIARLEAAAEALRELRGRDMAEQQVPAAVRELIDCDAIALRCGERIVAREGAVGAAEIDALASLGAVQAPRGQFVTDSLERFMEQDEDFRRRASGLAYLRIAGPAGTPSLEVLWLRQEQASTVSWAGNPAKIREVVDGEERISPRRSFEAWHDTRAGFCAPWSSNDRLLASKLAVQVLAMDREADQGVSTT